MLNLRDFPLYKVHCLGWWYDDPCKFKWSGFFSLRHERNINKRCMNYMYEDDMCGSTGDVWYTFACPKLHLFFLPKDHWTLKTSYFEDPTPAIQVQTLPLEGPRSLGLVVSKICFLLTLILAEMIQSDLYSSSRLEQPPPDMYCFWQSLHGKSWETSLRTEQTFVNFGES